MRDEGKHLEAALDEAIEIGRREDPDRWIYTLESRGFALVGSQHQATSDRTSTMRP